MSKPYREYTEQDIYNLVQEIKKLKEIQKAEFEIYESHGRFWDREFQKLKAENEELKKRFDKEPFLLASINNERIKYKQCLDEIEKICKHEIKNITDSCISGGRYFEILQKIREVKE